MPASLGKNVQRQRPRVLVLCSTFPRWRGDRVPDFIERLVTSLAADFQITVLAPHYPGARTLERWNGIVVFRYRYCWPASLEKLAYGGGILPNVRRSPLLVMLLPLLLLCGAWQARRLLRKRCFALLHVHWIIPQGLQARLARLFISDKPPMIITSHGGDLWSLQGAAGKLLKRFALRGCSAVTVVSSAMKPAVEELSSQFPVVVIPMGTEMDMFHPPASPAPMKKLLFAGRLSEKKGVAVLIRAMAHVDIEDVHLTIAGDGLLREELAQLAVSLGVARRITFAGWMDRTGLAEAFRSHGIFVFPSVVAKGGDQEGLGLTLAEAMASGCTVVASALPAVADLVIDGETGLAFAPGDDHALSRQISRLLSNPEESRQLAVNARRHVRNRFSMERTASEFHRLYESLIDGRAGL